MSAGTESTGSNGVADHVARANIRNHGEAIKGLREDVKDQREDFNDLRDTVSEFRRDWASYKPQLKAMIALASISAVGIMGVLGAEVWRLILARP